MGISTVVLEDWEGEATVDDFSFSGETEYSSTQFVMGNTYWDKSGSYREERSEFRIAKASFLDLDAVEFIGGGKFFLGKGDTEFAPYYSFYIQDLFLDNDLGVSLSLLPGLGLEYALSDRLYLDLGLSYSIPLLPATDTVFGVMDTEFSGLTLMFGIVFETGRPTPLR